MELICKECDKKYPYIDKNKKYASKEFCPTCLLRLRHRLKKYKLVQLLGGKCSSCGYDKCLAALHFHHEDPSKKSFDIGVNRWLSYEKLLNEAKKCILLCSNCHAEKHEIKIKSIYIPQIKFKINKKINKPTKEQLNKLLWEMPTTHIAKKYNVSDKAIEKWAKNYNISKPPRGYWQKLKAGLTTYGGSV